jgi:transposase
MLCQLSLGLAQLTADIAVLKAENTALRDKVKVLEERIAKDSHNSSKPPSSDGLGKPKPTSLRSSSNRSPGGQTGHLGHTLHRVVNPDHVVVHTVGQCENCGRSLADKDAQGIESRQVFDLPPPKLEVTEHRAEVKTCVCGCINRASFPPEAGSAVQYGPRVRAVAVYLKEYQLIPFDRLTEILRDLFACQSFSQGTLANILSDASRRLEPVDGAISDLVADSDVLGFDETGMRALGSLHWLHTASTGLLTWFFPHKRRGTAAMEAAGILPRFKGVAVHDFWESYLKYDCSHAFCNAHLLRELIFLWEEQGQKWAQEMSRLLVEIKRSIATVREAGQTKLSPDAIDRFVARYHSLVAAGYDQNPDAAPVDGPKRRGRRKQSKARNLLDRFRDHPAQILAFMHDFRIPFDNNQSERDLRMMKLHQKISGTFRSWDALVDFCRIRGYISTARKNGLTALDALDRLFAGNPFVPTSTHT